MALSSKHLLKLIDKLYVSNVKNRLRDLDEPSETDSKRWFWELLQNAKDSIAFEPLGRLVDIRLEVTNNKVVFSHNGAPFTEEHLLGLLYKYSEKKESTESTGRFGTGFLTTHTLSKIVGVEGDVEKENGKLRGFRATLYRDGRTDEELLEGMRRMRETVVEFDPAPGWTTFTYNIVNKTNTRALDLGVENIDANIVQTMLFCPRVGTVSVTRNGQTVVYTRGAIHEDGRVQRVVFEKTTGSGVAQREFVVASSRDHHDGLSERFATDRALRVDVAVEIAQDASGVRVVEQDERHPILFCVLPLVGAEALRLPFFLNSPDFEPTTERDGLFLAGPDVSEETSTITDAGINRDILLKAAVLFKDIVAHVSRVSTAPLFPLFRGLRGIPAFRDHFDKDWWRDAFHRPLCAFLQTTPLVKTPRGMLALAGGTDNAVFPAFLGQDQTSPGLHTCVDTFFRSTVVCLEDVPRWLEVLWDGPWLLTLDAFCGKIASFQNLSAFPSHLDALSFLNAFLPLVLATDSRLLARHALLPNANGVLCTTAKDNLATGIDINNTVVDVLRCAFNHDARDTLVHNGITTFVLKEARTTEDLCTTANKLVYDKITRERDRSPNVLRRLLPFFEVAVEPTKQNAQTASTHGMLRALIPELLRGKTLATTSGAGINDIFFENADAVAIEVFIHTIHTSGVVGNLPLSLSSLARFVAFLQMHHPSVLSEYYLLPNQLGALCLPTTLFVDKGIDDALKADPIHNMEKRVLQKNKWVWVSAETNFRSFLLHRDCPVELPRSMTNMDCALKINDAVSTCRKWDDGCDQFRNAVKYIMRLVPTQNETNGPECASQLGVHKAADVFFRVGQQIPVAIHEDTLWRNANALVVDAIHAIVSRLTTLAQFKERIGVSDDEQALDVFAVLLDVFGRSGKRISLVTASGDIVPERDIHFVEKGFFDHPIMRVFEMLLEDEYKKLQHPLLKRNFRQRTVFGKEDICRMIDTLVAGTARKKKRVNDETFRSAVALLFTIVKFRSTDVVVQTDGERREALLEPDLFPELKAKDFYTKVMIFYVIDENQLGLIARLLTDPNFPGLAAIQGVMEENKKLENDNKQLQEKNQILEQQAVEREKTLKAEQERARRAVEQRKEIEEKARQTEMEKDMEIQRLNEKLAQYEGKREPVVVYPRRVASPVRYEVHIPTAEEIAQEERRKLERIKQQNKTFFLAQLGLVEFLLEHSDIADVEWRNVNARDQQTFTYTADGTTYEWAPTPGEQNVVATTRGGRRLFFSVVPNTNRSFQSQGLLCTVSQRLLSECEENTTFVAFVGNGFAIDNTIWFVRVVGRELGNY